MCSAGSRHCQTKDCLGLLIKSHDVNRCGTYPFSTSHSLKQLVRQRHRSSMSHFTYFLVCSMTWCCASLSSTWQCLRRANVLEMPFILERRHETVGGWIWAGVRCVGIADPGTRHQRGLDLDADHYEECLRAIIVGDI
ncbi:uncharacterized protein BJ212DRAFT_755757 [Suillus subaureus]|uniref:Uncharacterized protein n=1 Tax=Suillus subaureus TaxID=48587 RepID=A0A9P7DZS4_9AGAM|nr:uncharacterized protein BJ212DRAFT_755757 [Suillus subaureus]KAG1807272.1 hypothetical protein BJ212DRAFT_755757 [Suillus subaureus]